MQRSKNFKVQALGQLLAATQRQNEGCSIPSDVPTPPAVVGILEAVLWHPGLHWHVEDVRVQCNTVGLYVDYVFTAHFELDSKARHNVTALTAMFARCLKRNARLSQEQEG